MNEKIPLKKFAEQLASNASISIEEAEADIKQLFSLIADELRTGQPVSIKGLGEFSLTSDPENPVMFTPEAEWADEVNAPFAMFEPVEVNPKVSEEQLNAITVGAPKPISAAAETEPTPEHIVEAEVEAGADAMEEVEKEMTEAYSEDSSKNREQLIETQIEAQSSPLPMREPAPTAAPIPEPAPNPAPVQYLWPEEEEELAEREITEAPADITPDITEEEIIDDTYETQSPHSSGFGRGFIVGLIIGLAIGALALCAYVFWYVDSSPSPTFDNDIETELAIENPNTLI